MFINDVILPENDINPLVPIEDMVFEKDAFGRPKGAQPVDQFDAQPFLLGENGFRRSDISIMMHAESDDLKASIASRMDEVKSTPIKGDYTDEELASMCIPRRVQSQSDFRDWYASIKDRHFEDVVNDWKKKHSKKSDGSIEFEKSDDPKAD